MLITRRSVVMAATASLGIASLAACSSGGESSSSSSSGLTYWATNQGTSIQNDEEILTPVLAEFTKQTGIKVDLQVIGWNDFQNKLQTAVTSGQAPDVTNIGNTWAPSLQATGAFLPFEGEDLDAIGGADKFVEIALATGGAQGQPVTSVPLYGLVYALYYNKQMFADAGLQPPTTWEEFVDAAKALTDPGAGVYGFAHAGASYVENAHFAFLTSAQNGGSWFDRSGEPTFATPENIDGIQRYLDLMQTDKVVNTSDAQYDTAATAVADFAQGKVAMVTYPSSAGVSIAAQGMADDAWGVVPIPSPAAGEEVASFPAGTNISIFKNTDNKEGALKLVDYLTSADVQAKLDQPYNALPVLAEAASATDVSENTKTYLDIYNTKSKPLPLVPGEDQFEATVGKAMVAMFSTIATGGSVTETDIKAALEAAEEQVKQTIG